MKLISASAALIAFAAKSLAEDPQAQPEPTPEPENQSSGLQSGVSTHTENSDNPGTFSSAADMTKITDFLADTCEGNEMCTNLIDTLHNIESGENPLMLSRSNDPEVIAARKLKQLKVMILWLQPEHRFARYCFYGCWCLPDREHKLFTVGYGKPVDNIDGSCQRQSKCYECAKMDHPDRNCDPSDTGYSFKLHYDPLDPSNHNKKSLECTDDASKGGRHSCKRSICECDKKLSEDLREHFHEWYEGHHQEQGAFDAGANCLVDGCKNGNCGPNKVECCGKLGHGTRMPFKTMDGRRKCCGDKTYDATFQECCEGESLAAIGTC